MQPGKQRPAASTFTDRGRSRGAGDSSAALAVPVPTGWRRLRARIARAGGLLDAPDEREFGLALDRTLSDTLAALGIVFGAGVILFGAWDYWIAPHQAGTTVLVRLSLVLLGSAGYFRWGGRIPLAWRCALVYGTHTGAMILSSALLPDGLVLALPAITGAMFPLALVEPRLHRLFALVLPPSLLFLVLGAVMLPPRIFASCVLVYAVMLALVLVLAMYQGRLRRKDFLAERSLTWSVRHDSLCGILSRGYLLELAAHDVALARRYAHPLAVAMLDIDHFKRVNDTWGHPVGDMLLCAVSRACAAELRASDYLGRYGGEEFVCVMPETSEAEALACAERMRAAVGAVRLEAPSGPVQCTISIGVAALEPRHAGIDALLAAADTALYRAKSGGRNRVEQAPPHSSGERHEA